MARIALVPIVLALGLAVFVLLAAVVFLVVALCRRSRGDQQRHERISRELERINAMAAAGRISAEEAADLRHALQDQRPPDAGEAGRGRLEKSQHPVLFGVCGGLAEWLRWDVTLFRLGYALATLLIAGFPGIIAYIILAIAMPQPGNAPRSTGKTVALVLLVLLIPLLLMCLLGLAVGTIRASHSMGGVPTIQRLH